MNPLSIVNYYVQGVHFLCYTLCKNLLAQFAEFRNSCQRLWFRRLGNDDAIIIILLGGTRVQVSTRIPVVFSPVIRLCFALLMLFSVPKPRKLSKQIFILLRKSRLTFEVLLSVHNSKSLRNGFFQLDILGTQSVTSLSRTHDPIITYSGY